MHTFVVLSFVLMALPRDEGLDVPVLDVTTKGAPSEGIDGAFVRVRCLVYADFAVIEHNDPGLRGAPHVEVRTRKSGTPASEMCGDGAAKGARKVVVEDAYLMGAVGPYLVFRGADGFGLEHPLIVVRGATGATIVDLRATSRPARFTSRDGGGVSLAFELVVTSECGDPKLCLARERERASIAKETVLTIDKKSCRVRGDDESLLQLAVPARIDDLAMPKARVVDGIMRCGATP